MTMMIMIMIIMIMNLIRRKKVRISTTVRTILASLKPLSRLAMMKTMLLILKVFLLLMNCGEKLTIDQKDLKGYQELSKC